ncbi:MAG TPA: glycosyltransferase [Hyphomicrobiaceae bacterium]|jgi:glycosyltransferase involved in cell wall biosynthesis|nr:glycosyltransferase [Hyphomicrobiaceae bacterium]
MHPKLSVLMPVYNGARFLAEAIESILGQTFADFEFLILDDGSDDETPAILGAYAAKDTRIRSIRRPHRGLIATLNEGLAQVRSKLVARMDADDVAHPERLERQCRHMAVAQKMWVLGTQWDLVDANGKHSPAPKRMPTAAPDVAAAMLCYNALHHPTVLMRRDPILKLGGYRPAYRHAEDYDLWLRVVEAGGRIDNLDWIGLSYRVIGVQKDWQDIVGQVGADLARATHALRRAGDDDPTQNLRGPLPISAPSLLDHLIPETIGFYRLLQEAAPSRSAAHAHELMRRAYRIPAQRRHRRQLQEVLLSLVKSRSHWDAPMALGLLRALALHPGRFIRRMRGH